jgi:hypothetical protein
MCYFLLFRCQSTQRLKPSSFFVDRCGTSELVPFPVRNDRGPEVCAFPADDV